MPYTIKCKKNQTTFCFSFSLDLFSLEVDQVSWNTTREAKTTQTGLWWGGWEGREGVAELPGSCWSPHLGTLGRKPGPDRKPQVGTPGPGVVESFRSDGKVTCTQGVCCAPLCRCAAVSFARRLGGRRRGPSPTGQMSGGAAFPSKWQKLIGRWWPAVDRAQHEMESDCKWQVKNGKSQHWDFA